MFRQLLQRAGSPKTFKARDDVIDVLKSITRLRQAVPPRDLKTVHALAGVFVRLSRADVSVLMDVLQGVRLDPSETSHGRAAALWALCMPKADCDEAVWERAVVVFDAGIAAGRWHPTDVRLILQHVAYWGVYPPTLPHNLERYVGARAAEAPPSEVAALATVLTMIPETRTSPMLLNVAQRAAEVAEDLSPSAIGTICSMFGKVGATSTDLVIALQEQSVRFAEECDVGHAAAFLAFSAAHDPELLDVVGLKCICERIVVGYDELTAAASSAASIEEGSSRNNSSSNSTEGSSTSITKRPLTREQLVGLMKTLKTLPAALAAPLAEERASLLRVISAEVTWLFSTPEDRGGLAVAPVDLMQGLVSRFVHLVRAFYPLPRRAGAMFGPASGNKPADPAALFEANRARRDAANGGSGGSADDDGGSGGGAVKGSAFSDGPGGSSRALRTVRDDAFEDAAAAEQEAEEKHAHDGTANKENNDDNGDATLLPLPAHCEEAFAAIARFVADQSEAIVSDDNPPFGLIPNLFQAGTDASRQGALALITEAAAQSIYFPTIQTYRYLLEMADHNLFERKAMYHLRRQFAIAAAGIPMMQLATALKCFVRGQDFLEQRAASLLADGVLPVEEEVELEEDKETLQEFLLFCDEMVSKALSSGGIDVRASLSVVESLHRLSYHDKKFFDRMATYLNTKADKASPETHSRTTAANCREALGPALLSTFPQVDAFLTDVLANGEIEDPSETPSAWMNRNDPANFITPLTEMQEKGWELLHEMNDLRSADTEGLALVAESYLAILSEQRPDDLKFFFGVFADKVFKNDKLLKRALEHLLATGIVTKLSGHSISAMLMSLSQIRFTYYQTLKKFLLGVSEEQWSQLDAATIATILQGIGKLSLRLPAVLVHLGERLVVVHKLLTPVDTSVVLAALQALGYHDEAVLSLLMQHVANNARRFDEVALAVLWSSPSVHRLLTNEQTAVPLLTQTSTSRASPALQQKIVASIKKSALPREVIQAAILKIGPAADASSVAGRLAAASDPATEKLALEQ